MINCVQMKCFYFAFLAIMRKHIPRGRLRRLIRLPAAAFDLTWRSSRRQAMLIGAQRRSAHHGMLTSLWETSPGATPLPFNAVAARHANVLPNERL